MTALQAMVILLVAFGGLATVLAADPLRQTIVLGIYGLLLVLLLVVFQAPDVAMSMLVVGTVAFPLILLVTLVKIRGPRKDE